MESRAKFLGHSIHQMLIVFPLGLLIASVAFDAMYYFGGRERRWAEVAYWMIVSGLIGGLAAAIPGLIDWLAIPAGTRAKRIGLLHGLANAVGVVGLFGASWFLRRGAPATPPDLALLLSAAGLIVGGVAGWLGGELVDRLGVGVDTGANLDAPSSLGRLPATARGPAKI